MWPYNPNYKPKPAPSPLEKPKYEVGDTVKIWTVLKFPTGIVREVISDKTGVFYQVSYDYYDGRYFSEKFAGTDLTLMEKYSRKNCNCGSNSSVHRDWCNKTLYPNGW